MASSIIPDAKHQELNISFTFDEQYEEKAIIKALVDHTPYEYQFVFNPDVYFEDIKSALLSKQFKIVSRSPEILKLKIFFSNFEFKNVEKITLNTLKETITELNDKLQSQIQKNTSLENDVKELKKQFDLMTTKMADLSQQNNEFKFESIETNKVRHEQNKELVMRIQKLQRSKIQVKDQELLIKMEQKIRKNNEQMERKNENIKKQLQEKLNKLEQETKILWKQGRRDKFEEQQRQINKQSELQIEAQNKQYRFSKIQRHEANKIQSNNMRATNSKDNECGFALVDGIVFERGSSIKFRIQLKGYYVGVGLAIRTIIKQNEYKIPNKQIGNGCFMVFNDGEIYSHSCKEDNTVQNQFLFDEGNVIRVTTNGDQLVWVNQSKKGEYKIDIKLTTEEWAQASFCFHSNDGAVSIVV